MSSDPLIEAAYAAVHDRDLYKAADCLEVALDHDPASFYRHHALFITAFIESQQAGRLIRRLDAGLHVRPDLYLSCDPDNEKQIAEAHAIRETAIYNDKPSFLLTALPKSASASFHHGLISGFGLHPARISLQHYPTDHLIPSYVAAFARGGVAAGPHLDANPRTLEILKKNGVDRCVVHVRDLRQYLISSAHHLLRYTGDGASRDYQAQFEYHLDGTDFQRDMPIGRLIDTLLSGYTLNFGVQWLLSWLKAAEDPDFKVLFTTFREFRTDPATLYNDVMSFYGIKPARFSIELAGAKTESDLHFRSGEVDEWRRVMSPEQIRYCNKHIPEALFERFGWEP